MTVDTLSSTAGVLVGAAERIARAFRDGGRLWVDGRGRGVADAHHVVVEFMHPVTVGKRALPAFEGFDGRRDPDVTMAIAYGGTAPEAGADVVISDVAPAGPIGADPITIRIPADDPGASKVAAVLAYHVVWELVHLFLEATDRSTTEAPAASALYPMLFGSDRDAEGGVRAAALASAQAKIAESSTVVAAALEANAAPLARAAGLLAGPGAVYTFGNGGSSTDAADAATLLGPRAHALAADVATVTALANDVSFDVVFARQLATVGRSGDVAVGFSTSGNSTNVVEAARAARRVGMATVGFAGYDGGEMVAADVFDEILVVGSDSVHRIQEAQSALMGAIVGRLDS